MGQLLSGRVAVVTGGSHGIGAGVARRMAAEGAAVAVSGRDEAALEVVARSIVDAGGRAIGVPADATSAEDLDRLRERTEMELGPADILLAFAGSGSQRQALASTTDGEWRNTIEANLTTTFLTLRAFVTGMMERGRGAVVTMSSTAGQHPSGASLAYSAAKAGVIMLTRQLAEEAAPRGVRINCLAPSMILTERIAQRIPPAQLEQIVAGFPLGRVGTTDDVAEGVLFLVSDRSSWITGVTLDITGGRVTA